MIDIVKPLLKDIRDHSEKYFEAKSLEKLCFLITGYSWRAFECNETKYPNPLPGLNEFVAKKYNIHSSHGWMEIIQFFTPSEEIAFDTFYELLDEFYGEWWKF